MKGLNFFIELLNVNFNKISAKLKEELISYAQIRQFEIGFLDNDNLYIEGVVFNPTKKENKAYLRKVKDEIRKILAKHKISDTMEVEEEHFVRK